MKNIIPNEIYIMVGLWKAWHYKKLLSNGKNQLSGGLTEVGELCEFFLSNVLERLFCFVEMIIYLAIWSGKLVVFSQCQHIFQCFGYKFNWKGTWNWDSQIFLNNLNNAKKSLKNDESQLKAIYFLIITLYTGAKIIWN